MPKKSVNFPEENPATKKYTHTFSCPPAICLSEPYNDKDSLKRSAHKSKQLQLGRYHGADQFTTIASEACQPGIGYLSSSLFKVVPALAASANMKDKTMFLEVQRYTEKFKNGDLRPKGATKVGFMSGDFPKRDEYSNVMSTERLRETIHKEDHLSKKAAETRQQFSPDPDDPNAATTSSLGANTMPKQSLYDVVHRVPDVSLKYRRDDRQGCFYYMHERLSADAAATGRPQPQCERALVDLKGLRHLKWLDSRRSLDSKREGSAWVQAQLPNGTLLNVLVDQTQEQILAQNVATTAGVLS